MIWQFTQIWNDFLFRGSPSPSATRTRSPSRSNNLVASSTGVKEYNVDMAAAIIAAVPTLIVYVFAGKYFIRGLSAGARERLIHGARFASIVSGSASVRTR